MSGHVRHEQHTAHDGAQHHLGSEAHKIQAELGGGHFAEARNELQKEARLHPHEFKKLLQNIDSELKKHHQSPLSVEYDHGQVSHIHFGKHDIYGKQEEAGLPSAARRDIHSEQTRYQHFAKHHGKHARQNFQRFAGPGEGHSDSDTQPQDRSGPGSDHPVSPTAASPSKSGFGQKLLEKLGLPATEKNLAFLDKWQKAEGGSPDNPFNTTQGAPGARNFNSVGVKRYPSIDIGVEATAKTLKNGHYNSILHALGREDANSAAAAVRQSPWGTKHLYV